MNSRIIIFIFTVSFSSTCSLLQESITTRRPLNYLPCSKDEDCSFHAYCHYGTCTCKTGFFPFRETKKSPTTCIKEATHIEDYCEKDVQCQTALGLHSFCMKYELNLIGKCHCKEDAHYGNGLCHKTAFIGGTCEGNDNCLIKSKHLKAFCQYSRCICPPMHHPTPDGTDCHPYSELGGPCINNDGCITLNSRCKQGFCTCNREYMPNFNNMTCLLVAKRLGDPCEEDDQCLVAHLYTVCHNESRVCACGEGAHMMEGTCWKTAKLLEPCGDTNECQGDPERGRTIECSHGICQCRTGYLLEEQKECVKWDPKAFGSGNICQLSLLLLLSALFLAAAV